MFSTSIDADMLAPHTVALDALIVALTAMSDTSRGGLSSTSKSWRRTIYLITDASQPMNRESVDAIADRLKADNVSLRVIGIDFDDAEYGFKEEDKDPIKAENESWWTNWLAELPEARIASAVHALDQATLPTVQLKTSAPYKTMLTFGDPSKAYNVDSVLSIPVKLYKLTTRVLPMSRRTLSKLAEESESARRASQAEATQLETLAPTPTPKLKMSDLAEQMNTYEVETRRVYFLSDQVREHGTENAQALPEGAEMEFGKAYRLGASLIPITPDLDVQWESEQGLEIINWVKASTFQRHFVLGDVWNVFADEGNLEAQVKLSSLAQAMRSQQKLALVRFVRRANAEPKIGVLHPVDRAPTEGDDVGSEYFHFAEVPFSEDLKRYAFPSLDRVVTADGKELKDHRSLPSDKMVAAMGDLVDSMDLMSLFKDEEGNEQPWFSTEDSFNPGIHRMKEAVAWRVLHQGSKDIPRPHWEVDKFLDRPEEVREASQSHVENCRKLFNVRYYPDKMMTKAKFKQARSAAEREKKEQEQELDLAGADVDGDEMDIKVDDSQAAEIEPAGKRSRGLDGRSQARQPVSQGRLIGEDSDTDDELEMLAPSQSTSVKREPRSQSLSTPVERKVKSDASSDQLPSNGVGYEEENADDDDDDDRLESPIRISRDDPVGSFYLHMENPRRDQSEVIRVLQRTIVNLVHSKDADAAQRAQQCLRAGKKAAAEYDESEEWNAFLRAFRGKALGVQESHGTDERDDAAVRYMRQKLEADEAQAFWDKYCKGRVDVAGLITADEDEGGRSQVTAQEAQDFVR